MGAKFVEAFDIFFKFHKNLNISYHGALLQFMLVVECYIFQIKDNQGDLTPKSLRSASKIFK